MKAHLRVYVQEFPLTFHGDEHLVRFLRLLHPVGVRPYCYLTSLFKRQYLYTIFLATSGITVDFWQRLYFYRIEQNRTGVNPLAQKLSNIIESDCSN